MEYQSLGSTKNQSIFQDLLNDTMIDFYLNHIVEHVLPDNRGSKVTVLPSIFWHNLSLRQHALDSDDEKMMSEEQKMDLKFGDLHDFVADFDLQDFDYIVVPVNEWEHWSLAVICHPFTVKARTVIFDSQLTADLNNLQNMANLLESFMKYSYEKRTGSAMPFSLPCVLPQRMPQQTNNFDCGVFIAEFARCFLLNPPQDVSVQCHQQYPDPIILARLFRLRQRVSGLLYYHQESRDAARCSLVVAEQSPLASTRRTAQRLQHCSSASCSVSAS